jgi:hypothetical protein
MPPTATDLDHTGVSVYCDPAPDSMFPIGTTTVTCTATDPFGHTAATSFPVSVGDSLGPVISVTPISASATSSAGATVDYPLPTATDQVSGPAAVTCSPAAGSTFPLGTTLVTCTATDGSANTTSRTFPLTVVDTTPPVPSLPSSVVASATSASGAVVTYSASAHDAVDGNVGIACTPAAGSMFPLGNTLVSCSASDAAGNHVQAAFTVKVQAQWSGIQQPINSDGSSIFRLSSTVPIRFALTGASANITNLPATLSVTRLGDKVTGSVLEATYAIQADTGNVFHYDPQAHQYVYNLAAKQLAPGDWLVKILISDGVPRTVKISLVK